MMMKYQKHDGTKLHGPFNADRVPQVGETVTIGSSKWRVADVPPDNQVGTSAEGASKGATTVVVVVTLEEIEDAKPAAKGGRREAHGVRPLHG